MKIRNLKSLGFVSFVLLATILGQNALAVSATLYGEIIDDGGDPNLLVWFEWGTTTAYGNQTPPQTKFGTGTFSATITGLAMCTTYHYRAAARHQAYNDTRFGDDKTFTTQCPVSVDLEVNGSDGPVTLPYTSRTITLSWTSSNANTCNAETVSKPSGSTIDWSGSRATSGSNSLTLDRAGTYIFRITCRNNTTGETNSDTVQVNLQQPNLVVVTRGVVITY
jgi:hypothetical protein